MPKSRVLFLCTGNSARSQMAEGLVNHFLAETWEAFSAGTKPSGYVHPLAIQVMVELGINLSAQRSKSTDEFRGVAFDRVIMVCDHAARNCPAWLGQGIVKHIGFPDRRRLKVRRKNGWPFFARCAMGCGTRCLHTCRAVNRPQSSSIFALGARRTRCDAQSSLQVDSFLVLPAPVAYAPDQRAWAVTGSPL
jgi:arsenate reductase